MSDRFENNNFNRTKRRRCFYDFSKNYPGTRYDKNKRSSTTDELDSKRFVLKKALTASVVILSFFIAYFVVFTVIGISHENVDGLDEIGATTVTEAYSVSDEDLLNLIKEHSTRSSQEETTTQPSTAPVSDNTQ